MSVKRSWTEEVFRESAPVPSNSQPKKQTHSLQWVLLEEDLVISPTCVLSVVGTAKRAWNDPGICIHVSQPNLSSLSKVGCMPANG